MQQITKDDQTNHALCLSLAALLGENVYNFGELVNPAKIIF